MGNLRIKRHSVVDTQTLKFYFNADLDSTIGVGNMTIESLSQNVPDGTVVSLSIDQEELTLNILPLTTFGTYNITFFSTDTASFSGINGDLLLEDGKTNVIGIVGPPNPSNDILDSMNRYFLKTPFKIDGGTLIQSTLNASSNELYKARNTINQLRSDNYLSINIENEFHTRGKGPYDRFQNEGVYEVTRMGPTPADYKAKRTTTFSLFPRIPVTLQSVVVLNENVVGGNSTDRGTFNGLTLNMDYDNVIKVTNILIIYSDASTFSYNTANYGYQIKDSRYDEYASTLTTLAVNQIKLSEKALQSGMTAPVVGDRMIVSYEYKNTGIDIDRTTIELYEVMQSVREVCPPISTVFSLNYSNVTKSTGRAAVKGDIRFLDPKATPPFSAVHAAFANEMTFSTQRMPAAPGQYSVDYANGKVYVFGSDNTRENTGTGPFPPVCTYYHKNIFQEDLDYTYEPVLREISSRSNRNLINEPAVLEFYYNTFYVDGVDYNAQIHREVLSERIQNRLHGNNAIKPSNSPITNVFRIFNETTGEIYKLNRFDDNKIYFNFTTPPNIMNTKDEKASFETIYDEVLVNKEELSNGIGLVIWKVALENNNIINSSEDAVASSINTSISFSDKETFIREIYFNYDNSTTWNLNRLAAIGDYVIDYANGLIYIAVQPSAESNIGSVTYKSKYILTNHDNIMTVNKIYSSIYSNVDAAEEEAYRYNTFTNTKIDLLTYPVTDRKLESTNPDIPILVSSNMITLPVDSKSLRGAYESVNLNTTSIPINFATGSIVDFSTAELVPIEFITSSSVSVTLTVDVLEVAANSNFVISSVVYVKRISDGYELYNTQLADGSFTGSTITLPTDTLAVSGDLVNISVMLYLADNSAVVVDIDYGGLFLDYNSLMDEVIISYEYGDNVLDFRESESVAEGDVYYVSYKYGALRDSLLANFGSTIDIDQIHNFDVDLNRERYRDALMACMQTFPKGPTIGAIKEIAKTISHVEPDLMESLFEEWVLGSSRLYEDTLSITGGSLLPAVWDYGLYFVDDGDTLNVPVSSNFKIDGGTFEFWTIPNWNGIDNDATLTFQLYKDGYILENDKVFIGATGYNPTYDTNDKFSVSRFDSPIASGQPHNIRRDGYGAFIYYDDTLKYWNIITKDQSRSSIYSGTVETSGEFYDVRSILLETSDIRTTKNSLISFTLKLDGYDGYIDGYDGYVDGIKWMSDELHYLFDYAETANENRISIFKDGKGYLNLRVYSNKDRYDRAHAYQISHDISNWESGYAHHIAVSNTLNSRNHRDELHFFIDGFEVPNSLKYGGRPIAATTDRFRTVVPEIVAGVVTKNTLAANDMITTAGSNIVTSASVDFGLSGILAGDTIYIEEQGFAASYTITSIVDFRTLQLSSVMPVSMRSVTYSINKWTAAVSTNIMYESNLLVSRYDGTETELPGLRATVPAYAVSVDSFGQPSIVIRSGAQAGDQIYIRTLGMNHRRVRERMYVWSDGYENYINSNMPPPINLDYTNIYPVTKLMYILNSSRPSYGNSDGVIYTAGNDVSVIGITPDTQPSNEIGGRTLSVKVSGSNIDFINPVRIRINGTTWSGALFEDISFTSLGTQTTSEQFMTISDIDGYVTTVNPLLPSANFTIKETNQITVLENDGYVPVLRYSLRLASSYSFSGAGTTATNTVLDFYNSQTGKSLVMTSPAAIAGTYIISDVVDSDTLEVSPAFPVPFTNGRGSIYDVSISRSGFQNGLFYFEISGNTPDPYMLKKGYYDFDYSTYLEIPFELRKQYINVGSDYLESKQAKTIIDEMRFLTTTSVDTRIGEALPASGRSITTDYLRSKPFTADEDTSLLLHMNENPPENSATPYSRYSDQYLQTDSSLNDEFGKALYIGNPVVVPDNGIISNQSGTIEFWFSPAYDSRNDMNKRYLFDANSAVVEDTTSLTKTTVILTNRAKQVYSIQLSTDDTSTGTNYAIGGSLSADKKTYTLGKSLPFQQIPIKVIYSPTGTVGNRISIYKDTNSTCKFDVFSGNKTYTITTPVFWSRDTWHRIMATWDFSISNHGQMHLFIDGEEKNVITAGSFLAGTGFIAGTVAPNNNITLNIRLRDQFQELNIGGNFLGGEVFPGRIDNFKISKIRKTPIYVSGQPYDNDYSSNLSTVLPVVEDLYTTYMMEANKTSTKIDDFSILKNKTSGIFDFTLDVMDSFDIINDDARVRSILEKLIEVLKPAQSRAFINYL